MSKVSNVINLISLIGQFVVSIANLAADLLDDGKINGSTQKSE